MYISSFYPQPMGGLEMQGLKLAQHLKKLGLNVVIFTHGFKGCKKKDVHENIEIVRLYSWLNVWLEVFQAMRNKVWPRKTSTQKQNIQSNGQLPYDKSDTGIKINGKFLDLVYYSFQTLNFIWRLRPFQKNLSVIHVHGVPWVSFVGVCVGRIYRIPVLIKESTTIGLKKYDDILFGRWMRNRILEHGYFVAISQFIKKEMQKYKIQDRRIFYIPNGVAIPDHPAFEKDQNLNILFVGNLSQGAAKGLDVLLLALQQVIKNYPSAQLLIAGNNPNPVAWERYLTSIGIENNVVFLGSKSSMNEIFEETTVFVSPSRREGLSNALLEAMAFGLPSVVTDISGSQDMIENNVSGFIVEPDNVSEMANAIEKIFSSVSLRQSMRQMAHAKVKSTCCFQKIAMQYKEIYLLMSKKATA